MKKYSEPTAEYVQIKTEDVLGESRHGVLWDEEWLDALGGGL